MAKLIVLALAFAALVAFASAHSTIVTTTLIAEENPSQQQQQQQCSQQVQGQRVNQCQKYLQQQGQSWYGFANPQQQQQQGDLQSCCQELQSIQGQCQCEAVKEAFRQAVQKMQQQQQQGGSYGSQQIGQLMQKAQNLPNQCSLQTRQCQVGSISITTTSTTTITDPQQSCQHIRQRQFNQCKNYVQEQQQQRGGSFLISINRQGQQQQGVQKCCNELQNVEQQCQCEALQQVYSQAQQQMQQQQQQQRGGQSQQDLQQIVQNLRNQCNLQAQQCQIPSAMF